MPFPIAAAAIPYLIQAGAGIVQNIMANQRKKNAIRPEYNVPPEMERMLAMYEHEANAPMPGEDIAREQIQSNTGQAVNAASEQGAGVGNLGFLADVYRQENQRINELAIQGAEYRRSAKRELAGALQSKAGYRDQAWQLNKLEPWNISMNDADSLRTAGMQNLGGAFSGYTGYMANKEGMDNYLKALQKMNPWNINNGGIFNGQQGTPQYQTPAVNEFNTQNPSYIPPYDSKGVQLPQ